jgi:hypothetical protein
MYCRDVVKSETEKSNRHVAAAVVLCFAIACSAKSTSSGQKAGLESATLDSRAATNIAAGANAAAVKTPNPAAHRHAILRPTFMVDATPLSAGTAFLIQPKGHSAVLVTAHHLFGPAGGLARDLSWQELPRMVRSFQATSIDDDSVTVIGGPPLAVDGAESVSDRRVGGDLAIFPITKLGAAHALQLADGAPKVGDRVALLAELHGTTRSRHGATIVEVGADYLAYTFDDQLELRGSSGAPVVDAAERVVAINVSGGLLTDGRLVGIGNSIVAFGPAIQRALAVGQTSQGEKRSKGVGSD